MGIACSWSCCIDGFHRCSGPSLSSDRRPWCVGIGPAFRHYWRWKSRSFGGRPQIDADLRALIRRMSVDNPLWGAPRIHDERIKLGPEDAQSTVPKYTVKRCGTLSQRCWTFLRKRAADTSATDLTVVPGTG